MSKEQSRIRVCTVCGEPFDTSDDDDRCRRCSLDKVRAFEVRQRLMMSRNHANSKPRRDSNPDDE